MARTTIDELLADARRRLRPLCPAQALQAMSAGAVLIDIRSDSQVARDGIVTGALVILATSWNGRAHAGPNHHIRRGRWQPSSRRDRSAISTPTSSPPGLDGPHPVSGF